MAVTVANAATADSEVVSAGPRTVQRAAVASAVIGNILEWYDFAIYAYFAALIGKNFFPAADATAALLQSFAVFGIGYVARPLGGILVGRYADKVGRRPALIFTILLMAVGTAGIGLIPSYASIGLAATLLITLCRLAQGFSSGGEVASSMTYLVEWAQGNRRGYFGSFQTATVACGLLLGSTVAASLSTMLSAQDLSDWGWRLAFIFGGLLGPIGLWMRRANVVEAPVYRNALAASTLQDSRRAWIQTARAFGFTIAWTVSYYVCVVFMPTFLQSYAKVERAKALWTGSMALLLMIPAMLVAGRLSDSVGRKPLLVTSCLGLVLLPYPLFQMILASPTIATIAFAQTILALLVAMFSGPGPAALAELFATSSRTTLTAIGYGFATAIFGGFAPLLATWLIKETGDVVSPTWYVSAAAAVSLLVIVFSRETSRDVLG
jgi:MFS transporter, MHS family, proline/betaine transporter